MVSYRGATGSIKVLIQHVSPVELGSDILDGTEEVIDFNPGLLRFDQNKCLQLRWLG